MMLRNKVICGILLAIFGYSISMMAQDVRDQYGRTKLMQYVISTEEEYENAKLYSAKKNVRSKVVSYYSEILQKTKYSMGLDVMHLVNSGININAKDNEGKTALSFCQTKEMYNVLRENGADFQFDAWMRVYQTEIALGSLVITGSIVYYLNQEGILTADTVSTFAKDTQAFLSLMVENIKNEWNAQSYRVQEFLEPMVKQAEVACAQSLVFIGQSIKDISIATKDAFVKVYPKFDIDSFELGVYTTFWVFFGTACIDYYQREQVQRQQYFNYEYCE